ncbi:hypothetical protein [Pseudomonas sp. D(2018)]|uniref:hypothetical protein n=1 Tax=Pseudomonas sp. D(2018) TaxID=2502238 RepID=UPI0010F8413D|nr:hypothetical protein [Pseudomonas sp. D(2018)]
MGISFSWMVKFVLSVPGVVSLLALGYLVYLGAPYSEVGAAWVQAVGSVLAIIVAVVVANHESKARAREARQQDRETLKKVIGVVRFVTEAQRGVGNILIEGFLRGADTSHAFEILDESASLLEQVEFKQISVAEVALAWLEFKRAAKDIIRVQRRLVSGTDLTHHDLQLVTKGMGVLLDVVGRLIRHYEEAHIPLE